MMIHEVLDQRRCSCFVLARLASSYLQGQVTSCCKAVGKAETGRMEGRKISDDVQDVDWHLLTSWKEADTR